MFRASRGVTVEEVFEVLSSRTQVASSFGSQLGKARDGTTSSRGSSDGVNEQAILNQANVYRCIESLGQQTKVPWATCDVLPQFAKRHGIRAGRAALLALQAYEPWALDVDSVLPEGEVAVGAFRGPQRGLREVWAWMGRVDVSLRPWDEDKKIAVLRAGKMLADAKVLAAGYVDLWNRQGGFKSWLGLEEFALKFAIPLRTAQRWCNEGKLPAVLVRGRYRIDISEVPDEADETPGQGGHQVFAKPRLDELDAEGADWSSVARRERMRPS